MSSGLGLPYSISLLYGSMFWGYSKGSRANSNYEFIGIKCIKCYLPWKIHLRCDSACPFLIKIFLCSLHRQESYREDFLSRNDLLCILETIIAQHMPCKLSLLSPDWINPKNYHSPSWSCVHPNVHISWECFPSLSTYLKSIMTSILYALFWV